ncbi:hypothetical protein NDU88_005264 [Pleurodeles waltl]|uniref:Uncharacterized protein n=1 Tax=Pleurodeles waltl TaxID=8319 RepID=A0AAV7L079_PLEWA|nr:hypothetical protein NDU88_005264 [Pleurodeles waltl]
MWERSNRRTGPGTPSDVSPSRKARPPQLDAVHGAGGMFQRAPGGTAAFREVRGSPRYLRGAHCWPPVESVCTACAEVNLRLKSGDDEPNGFLLCKPTAICENAALMSINK